jgi:hypothetical protein
VPDPVASLNNQHGLEGSDVVAGQGDRANTQGQVGLVLTSSNEEEAGEPFSAVYPLSVAPFCGAEVKVTTSAACRSRHSGQSCDTPAR